MLAPAKWGGYWRKPVGSCRRDHLVAPAAAAVSGVVSLLKKADKSSGKGYAATDVEDASFPFQLEIGSKTVCDFWLHFPYV